jgi:hypothetical protein
MSAEDEKLVQHKQKDTERRGQCIITEQWFYSEIMSERRNDIKIINGY